MKPINLSSKIDGTLNFTWAEALWLPRWGVHVFPDVNQHDNIISIAQVLQRIRNDYHLAVHVHSWLRPDSYNSLVGGAPQSWHKMGGGVDFSVADIGMDDVRSYLEPKLEELNIRMELSTPMHVHIDNKPVKPHESRTFLP